MNTPSTFALPDHREQSSEVAARFAEIRERPVVMRIDGLGKAFRRDDREVQALDNIAYDVHRGEFISVIGPSGCGKSTLIRILAGLDDPTEGAVLLDGSPVEEPGADRGMVFQGYTLFPWLTVEKNVMFGLKMRGVPKREARKQAHEWIELVGLTRFVDAYPAQLSGGMKQRVAIARALANQPRILLMDEPFGALDAQTRAHMQAHLLRIWREIDVTIMFITHDLDEAVYLSDRVVAMGANPGHIQDIVEVPVPRPRSPDQFLSGPFLATKKYLEDLIHPRTAESDDVPEAAQAHA